MTSAIHILTPEFPPQPGGVSDFTLLVADGLALKGAEVHVWCPNAAGEEAATAAVVHRSCGGFRPADLYRLGRELSGFPGPRHLLVQWVPHQYGYRSLNIFFCFWLWGRALLRGDKIQLFVHEPFLAFREGSLRQDFAAVVHRLMIVALLMATTRVFMSVPGWEAKLRPYALGRNIAFEWSPIPSNISVTANAVEVAEIRDRLEGALLLGHFGTYGKRIREMLEQCIPPILAGCDKLSVLLLGRGGTGFRNDLLQRHPALATRILATGDLPPARLSSHIQACDLVLQPYPDGISSRRTSAMVSIAHGKPVVTTEGHLTEELWSERNAVALAKYGDNEALVRQVHRLAKDGEERRRLGCAAAELYAERFALAHTLARLGYD